MIALIIAWLITGYILAIICCKLADGKFTVRDSIVSLMGCGLGPCVALFIPMILLGKKSAFLDTKLF